MPDVAPFRCEQITLIHCHGCFRTHFQTQQLGEGFMVLRISVPHDWRIIEGLPYCPDHKIEVKVTPKVSYDIVPPNPRFQQSDSHTSINKEPGISQGSPMVEPRLHYFNCPTHTSPNNLCTCVERDAPAT